MKRFTIQILVILVAVHAPAEEWMAAWNAQTVELLQKNCIVTRTEGLLPTRFETAAAYLNRPDLVSRIQEEYRRAVSRDGTLDYSIVTQAPGDYYYINEKNQRTDISELYRTRTSESSFDLAYYAKGKRFFGTYEALIFIRILDAGPAGTAYTASVYAYPHNGPVRFFARRFGTVEKYFQRKTRTIAWVSRRMCGGMDGGLPLSYSAIWPVE